MRSEVVEMTELVDRRGVERRSGAIRKSARRTKQAAGMISTRSGSERRRRDRRRVGERRTLSGTVTTSRQPAPFAPASDAYPQTMQATLEPLSRCAILRVSGDLRLWDHEDTEQRLLTLIPTDMSFPGNRLILSLGGLTNIDSLGITALVKILIACVKNQVGLCTVLPRGTAGQSIRSTRIFAAWPEFNNEDAALNQFAHHAAS